MTITRFEHSPPEIATTVASSGHEVFDHVSGVLSSIDRIVIDSVPPGGNWRDLPEDFPSKRIDQIRASSARGEGSRSTYYGRLKWDAPSYTVSTYFTRPGNGCFIHPGEPRLITVREAARLQTFPDYWRFRGTVRNRAMQIGNAVPPLLAFQIGKMIRPGTVVDLFAGVGGLSLGLKLAGHDLVAAVDHDLPSVAAHNINLGGEAFAADLDTQEGQGMAWSEIRARVGNELDLLAGGPPCQGFSTAGNAAQNDPRNRLLWSFVEGVRMLKPRTVLMENVVALAQSRGKHHLEAVRSALLDLGYSSEIAILHAEAYGVPQRRRRLILIASRDKLPEWPPPGRRMERPFFAKQQPLLPPDRPGFSVRDAIGDLPGHEAQSLDESVAIGSARSELQRWLRGEIDIDALIDD